MMGAERLGRAIARRLPPTSLGLRAVVELLAMHNGGSPRLPPITECPLCRRYVRQLWKMAPRSRCW